MDARIIRSGSIPQYILDSLETDNRVNKVVGAASDFLLDLYKSFWKHIWVHRCKKFIEREERDRITKGMKHQPEKRSNSRPKISKEDWTDDVSKHIVGWMSSGWSMCSKVK
jgi:hypothetical protein